MAIKTRPRPEPRAAARPAARLAGGAAGTVKTTIRLPRDLNEEIEAAMGRRAEAVTKKEWMLEAARAYLEQRGGGSPSGGIDPSLRSILDRLPPADAAWPVAERKVWLRVLENTFDLVYKPGPDAAEDAA